MFQKSSGPVCFSRAGKIYLHLSNVNYWLWRGSFIPTCQFAVLFAGPPPVLAIQSSLLVQKIPRIPIFLVVWFRRNPLDLIPIKSTQKKKKKVLRRDEKIYSKCGLSMYSLKSEKLAASVFFAEMGVLANRKRACWPTEMASDSEVLFTLPWFFGIFVQSKRN